MCTSLGCSPAAGGPEIASATALDRRQAALVAPARRAGDELADRRACSGDLRRAPKHRSLQEAAGPRNRPAVADVVERDQLAAGYMDDTRHTQQSCEADGQCPSASGPEGMHNLKRRLAVLSPN